MKRPRESGPELNADDIELERKIGKGCFGEVWKGTLFRSPVAVKIPFVQDLDAAKIEELRLECEVMQSHPHNNICRFMGASLVPGRVRIVTELLDGDVEHLLYSKPVIELSLYQKLRIAKDTVQGMIWLHNIRPPIIHRDLKPANLLYKEMSPGEYEIRVSDFGLSAMKEGMYVQDGKGGARGTPLYMAPEVMTRRPFNEKADVYSFAVVLWELIARVEPFGDHDDYKIFVAAVDSGERPPLEGVIPPGPIRKLMARCWAADPSSRPPFTVVLDELDRILVSTCAGPAAGVAWTTAAPRGQLVVNISHVLESLFEYVGALPSDKEQRVWALLLQDVRAPDGSVRLVHYGRVMRALGPVARTDAFLTSAGRLFQQPWFFGPLSSEHSRAILSSAPIADGTFLVRFSSMDGAFTIARKSSGKVGFIRILRREDGMFYISPDAPYPTVAQVIEGHRADLHLIAPCEGSPIAAIMGDAVAEPVPYA